MKKNKENSNTDKNILGTSYSDIINVLNDYVQKITKEHWKNDDPEFLVSLNCEEEYDQSIMITINHNNYIFSETLFPKEASEFGYEPILEQMTNMYNRTM